MMHENRLFGILKVTQEGKVAGITRNKRPFIPNFLLHINDWHLKLPEQEG